MRNAEGAESERGGRGVREKRLQIGCAGDAAMLLPTSRASRLFSASFAFDLLGFREEGFKGRLGFGGVADSDEFVAFDGAGGRPAGGEARVDGAGDGVAGLGVWQLGADAVERAQNGGGGPRATDPAEGLGVGGLSLAIGRRDPRFGGFEQAGGVGGDGVEEFGGHCLVVGHRLAGCGQTNGFGWLHARGQQVGASPAWAEGEAGFRQAHGVGLDGAVLAGGRGGADQGVAVHGDFEPAAQGRSADGGCGGESHFGEQAEHSRTILEVLVELVVGPLADGFEISPGDEDAGGRRENQAADCPALVLARDERREGGIEAFEQVVVEHDDGSAWLLERDRDDAGVGAGGVEGDGEWCVHAR